jgi:hypothetical protein
MRLWRSADARCGHVSPLIARHVPPPARRTLPSARSIRQPHAQVLVLSW